MTGFDGVSTSLPHFLKDTHVSIMMSSTKDYLQFTITSRAEMPNAEFAEEIKKAAEELHQLFVASSPMSQPCTSRGERLNFSARL